MEAARRIFKPFDERLNREAWLESEEDDPQVLIHIVFTAPVKIRALTLIGGSEGDAPLAMTRFGSNNPDLLSNNYNSRVTVGLGPLKRQKSLRTLT